MSLRHLSDLCTHVAWSLLITKEERKVKTRLFTWCLPEFSANRRRMLAWPSNDVKYYASAMSRLQGRHPWAVFACQACSNCCSFLCFAYLHSSCFTALFVVSHSGGIGWPNIHAAYSCSLAFRHALWFCSSWYWFIGWRIFWYCSVNTSGLTAAVIVSVKPNIRIAFVKSRGDSDTRQIRKDYPRAFDHPAIYFT